MGTSNAQMKIVCESSDSAWLAVAESLALEYARGSCSHSSLGQQQPLVVILLTETQQALQITPELVFLAGVVQTATKIKTTVSFSHRSREPHKTTRTNQTEKSHVDTSSLIEEQHQIKFLFHHLQKVYVKQIQTLGLDSRRAEVPTQVDHMDEKEDNDSLYHWSPTLCPQASVQSEIEELMKQRLEQRAEETAQALMLQEEKRNKAQSRKRQQQKNRKKQRQRHANRTATVNPVDVSPSESNSMTSTEQNDDVESIGSYWETTKLKVGIDTVANSNEDETGEQWTTIRKASNNRRREPSTIKPSSLFEARITMSTEASFPPSSPEFTPLVASKRGHQIFDVDSSNESDSPMTKTTDVDKNKTAKGTYLESSPPELSSMTPPRVATNSLPMNDEKDASAIDITKTPTYGKTTMADKAGRPTEKTEDAASSDTNVKVTQLQQHVQYLETQLAQYQRLLEQERIRGEKLYREEKESSQERIQALQLRLYIAETRLKVFEDALQQHVDTVHENVAHSSKQHLETSPRGMRTTSLLSSSPSETRIHGPRVPTQKDSSLEHRPLYSRS